MFSISDLFHNKPKGLFTLLNDECALQRPSMKNFDCNLRNAWKNDMAAPISWTSDAFAIRHFTNDVIYSTVC